MKSDLNLARIAALGVKVALPGSFDRDAGGLAYA